MTIINNVRIAILVAVSIALCFPGSYIVALSSLYKGDPYPVYETADPRIYLTRCEKMSLLGEPDLPGNRCHLEFSVSPFGQNANRGKTIEGKPLQPCPVPTDPCNQDLYTVPLGDLTGRTSMLALFYGNVPTGMVLSESLQTAKEKIFDGITLQDITPAQLLENTVAIPDINDMYIDPKELFGFFSFDERYRKRGLRFNFQVEYCDFGLQLQTGVSSIRMLLESSDNLTTDETFPAKVPDPAANYQITSDDVDFYLMDKLNRIADEINLDMCNFVATSVEEVRLSLFWRHVFELNANDREYRWPYAFVIPFFEVTGSFSPGKGIDPNVFLSQPFGNNKHNACGFTAGIDFDFVECLEIGGEVGYTHFFPHTFHDYRVPTSEWQMNIYPFTTDVRISPGANWHFAGKISAYHFLDMLSMYFQYVIVDHKKDSIQLADCNTDQETTAFRPDVLECVSSFKVKLANIGFNYDISPNLSLGFLWQAPLSQRNAFRSTTIMFSFTGMF